MAWKIVKGTEKGSWKPHWLHLFQSLLDAVPDDWQVIVSADRGQYCSVKGKRRRGKGKEKTFNPYPLTFPPSQIPSLKSLTEQY